jgi:branched-chain amino acid transport system ATP-binding protein
VIGELTVEENLRLGSFLRPAGAGTRAARRSNALSDTYDLFPALARPRHQPAFTLSGGERQMLAIGRALVARPNVLLLDEPSLGLAPLVVRQIMGLLQRLKTETGVAVVLVEQNARSALSVADRALVLNLGQVVRSDDAVVVAADDGLRHAYLGF